MNSMFYMLVVRSGQIIRNGQRRFAPALMQNACLSTKKTVEEPAKSTQESVHEDSESSSSDEEKLYMDEIKAKILTASMEFVKEEGWSKEALAKGAKSVGYASTVHSIFPHGPAHLVHFFTQTCNNNLAQQMEKTVSDKEMGPIKPVKFIEDSIITRIKMIEPYKSKWNSALAAVINSKLVLEQASTMLKLSDDICYFAGDRSVNSTWYARRAVVAGVYQASELHWLGGGKDTRSFAATQLQTAANLEEIPKNISALLTVMGNILPINLNR